MRSLPLTYPYRYTYDMNTTHRINNGHKHTESASADEATAMELRSNVARSSFMLCRRYDEDEIGERGYCK